jgi:two-component system, chemotaxis family, chemotaxis protein CheY
MATIRTLIVDDTMFIRMVLKQVLLKTEFQVVGEAGDGNEAVTKYEELQPDLVVMDIIMPSMSGLDAVRQIMCKYPEADIVMCSALGQDSVIKQALAAGARDYIVKPFVPDQVLGTLRGAALNDGCGAAA